MWSLVYGSTLVAELSSAFGYWNSGLYDLLDPELKSVLNPLKAPQAQLNQPQTPDRLQRDGLQKRVNYK